jgi:effector-binding domain-containing protein
MVNDSSLADALEPKVWAKRRVPARARGNAGRAVATQPCETELTQPCQLVTLAPRLVLVMRFRSTAAELPRGFFHRYALMTRHALGQGQSPASPPFAMYENNDGNAADVEAGFTIDSGIESDGGMMVKHLPGGTVASLVHRGPYADIEPSYFQLLEWMHENGLQRAGRFMEVYLNSPIDTSDDELLTQIMVPVCPEAANDP